MITVRLLGGLGNQMFQYAAVRSLASKLDAPLCLDTFSFEHYADRDFDLGEFTAIDEPVCTREQHEALFSKSKGAKLKRKLFGRKLYREPFFHVDPAFFRLTAPIAIDGYFQSEQYFISNEAEIRQKFSWDIDGLAADTRAYLAEIQTANAVSVHFRRGDYVADQTVNNFHGTCSPAYYQAAIEYIKSQVQGAHFYVFSDDIDWVKQQDAFTGVAHSYVLKSEQMRDSEEMFLMSQCRHNVVANSSFSWWGAWLNSSDEKIVIAPQSWFRTKELNTRDLIPAGWQRV
ncbi:MAG: alpha-1,2-fucosyltransferase [Gammaproteobacteria bacterium]|nr:alpha-1,2-fucosyltransferase [Gammaproteobacteria bacterium]MCP4088548.1 alpha-1,2-fucosyltransferase [Gammaproteobacteria bacterium]MCP4276712.1 alpha-1,2-fucosyltransferase [Gammaproteobacteria bacterium]MCP4832421.1 alpha-1,2-fucosyltransferase [Gammaproteobacteria bacterium]MCP4929862.1 alpha-1,2-fucosyltransferase [Gammaproteobacteria bacterium]